MESIYFLLRHLVDIATELSEQTRHRVQCHIGLSTEIALIIKSLLCFLQLPRDVILGVIPCMVNMIKAKSPVVHSYAANAIERIMTLRTPGGGPP